MKQKLKINRKGRKLVFSPFNEISSEKKKDGHIFWPT